MDRDKITNLKELDEYVVEAMIDASTHEKHKDRNNDYNLGMSVAYKTILTYIKAAPDMESIRTLINDHIKGLHKQTPISAGKADAFRDAVEILDNILEKKSDLENIQEFIEGRILHSCGALVADHELINKHEDIMKLLKEMDAYHNILTCIDGIKVCETIKEDDKASKLKAYIEANYKHAWLNEPEGDTVKEDIYSQVLLYITTYICKDCDIPKGGE